MTSNHTPSDPFFNSRQPTRRELLRLGGLTGAAALLPPWLAGCGGSDAGPAAIEVVLNDIPYPTEKNLLIGYMLSTREFEREGLTLDKIVVLDHDSAAELLTIARDRLPKTYKGKLGSALGYQFDTLSRYFMSLRLPIPLGQAAPRAIRHRLVFTNGQVVEGGVLSPRTDEQPLVIASPLRGQRLMFVAQSTMGYHFHMAFFHQGNIYTAERYAFDSDQLDETLNNFRSGDPTDNRSYFNYGSALYAVADGKVVQIENSLPENHGNAKDLTFNSLIEYAGNYVMLDIGGGNHACYMHCIPGSVTVRPGDTVRKGDVIARLGNSGNSTAPHLHFQICDGPDLFWPRGVPFVLEAYTKVGEAPGIVNERNGEVYGFATPRQDVTRAMMEETTVMDIA